MNLRHLVGRRAAMPLLCAAAALPLLLAPAGEAAAQQWRPPSQRSTAPSLNPVPQPRNEPRPAPRRGYIWVPGHWGWTASQGRVWTAGRWEKDRPGWRFVGPQWTLRGGEWVFVPGRWVR